MRKLTSKILFIEPFYPLPNDFPGLKDPPTVRYDIVPVVKDFNIVQWIRFNLYIPSHLLITFMTNME